MIDLRSLTLGELEDVVVSLGEAKFRSKQLFEWIHKKRILDIFDAKNISKACLEKLSKSHQLRNMHIKKVLTSIDGTRKFLMRLDDQYAIECVLMEYQGDKAKKRNTLCISTQVGCAMGCRFCATGTMGMLRNLTAGEIVQQVYLIDDILEQENKASIGNIVFMGMGEPFNNFSSLRKAVEILESPLGKNIGSRRITISTCGIVPKIYEFADWPGEIGLAISLHATDDKKRSALMPVNDKWPIDALLEACRAYQAKTNRRITFEYALIAHENDSLEQADKLVSLLRSLKAHVNLIPVNNVLHEDMQVPSKDRIRQFKNYLNTHGLSTSIREEKGKDIQGACGQLAIRA